MQTITLPTQRLELACDNADGVRPYLQHVFLDVPADTRRRGQLVATNGHFLVSVPMERADADAIGGGFISVDAIKAARKSNGELTVNLDRDQQGTGAVMHPRPMADDVGVFPKWRKVLPPIKVRRMKPDICVNAWLLWQVQQALTDGPTAMAKRQGLEIWAGCDDKGYIVPDSPMVCTLLGPKTGAFAVVMGMRSDSPELEDRIDDGHARRSE